MKDNNPFQPTLAKPADVIATDAAPDNFTVETPPGAAAKPPRPAVALDGISPSFNDAEPDMAAPAPIDSDTLAQALSNHGVVNDSDASAPSADAAAPAIKPFSLDDLGDTTATDTGSTPPAVDTDAPAIDAAPSDAADANDPLSQIAALADDNSDTPSTPPVDVKPPRQFTISIATIILFILTLAGIGGTIYFYIQNNKNADALADAKAKVQQLTDQSTTSNVSSNKTSDQFDGLQKNLADMTKKSEDQQKTLDDNKKTIDDQTKQIADLTAKTQTIDSLTSQLSGLLNNNCTYTDPNNGATPCTASITTAQGNQAATLTVKPKSD